MTNKICTKCFVIKEITEYNKHPETKDGLDPRCKNCHSQYSKNYYKQNKQKRDKQIREWQANNLKNGLCLQCTAVRLSFSKCYCLKHYFMDRSYSTFKTRKHWKVLQDMSKNANCALCLSHLSSPGLIEFDHILPRKKYPHLISNINNIQTLCKTCNLSKGDSLL